MNKCWPEARAYVRRASGRPGLLGVQLCITKNVSAGGVLGKDHTHATMRHRDATRIFGAKSMDTGKRGAG